MSDEAVEGRACESYVPIARSAAIYLQQNRFEVDLLGFDQDDYQSRFLEQAWRVEQQGVDWHSSRPAENAGPKIQSYIAKAVWNLARDYKRKRWCDRYQQHAVCFEPDRVAITGDLERQTENREILTKIRKRLSPKYWEVIEQYAEAGCKPALAWDPESGVNYETWKARLRFARTRARALYEKT